MHKTRMANVGVGLAATSRAFALNPLRDEVELVGVLGRRGCNPGRSDAGSP